MFRTYINVYMEKKILLSWYSMPFYACVYVCIL